MGNGKGWGEGGKSLRPQEGAEYLMGLSLCSCAHCSAPGRALQNFCFFCESDAGASGTHPRASPHPWEVKHPSLALSFSPSALGTTAI